MKPDNVLDEEPMVVGCGVDSPAVVCKITDFGNLQAVAGLDSREAQPRASASCINAAGYRPPHLFERGKSWVDVKLGHDLWAFGGIVFDVGQAGPRLRDETTGENLCLM
jgi:hypothetical protein